MYDLDETLVGDTWRFAGQAAIKHVATEADRLAVAVCDAYEAGLYASRRTTGPSSRGSCWRPARTPAWRWRSALPTTAASIGGTFAGARSTSASFAPPSAPPAAPRRRILKGNAPESDIAASAQRSPTSASRCPSEFERLCGCAPRAPTRGRSRCCPACRRLRVVVRSVRAAGFGGTGPPGLVAAGGAVMALRALVALYWRGRARFPSTAFVKRLTAPWRLFALWVQAPPRGRRRSRPWRRTSRDAVLGVLCLAAIFVGDRAFGRLVGVASRGRTGRGGPCDNGRSVFIGGVTVLGRGRMCFPSVLHR